MDLSAEQRKEEILGEYESKKDTYSSLGNSMISLIKALILKESIAIHTMNFRVKTLKSLTTKIDEKDKYESLSDITDVLGVRIVTYYANDVDLIEGVIKKEFLVDEENTVDKRKKDSPDRFGYMSLHYIVSINKDREQLVEYELFKGIRFEIQIRTILQHTWAEIEHDLGYKSKDSVPEHVRRKFSILSGCLELIDSQFVEISQIIKEYDETTKSEISSSAISSIGVDAISMKNYVLTSSQLEDLYRRYVDYTVEQSNRSEHELYLRMVDSTKKDEDVNYSNISRFLNLLGVNDINGVNDIISEMSSDDKIIASIYTASHSVRPASGGSGDLYIKYLFFIFVIYGYVIKNGGYDNAISGTSQEKVINSFKRFYVS